ncbi:MAG: D-glycero-beta-D-manno-heptose 1-phosphate adenylyltransferase [Planctomycetes bacterium]|nr:D-glycero-beta-D-manno-heptose 1-phosphate adenylyltransferase [Planctomycetota bacterium]
MSGRLTEILTRLGTPRLLIAGDLILDKYVWGSVQRVSPEAPVQILAVSREEYRLGGAANVARNLASLGARAACGGVIGRDEPGGILLRLLRGCRIDAHAVVRDAAKPTPVKTRMIAHNQQMLRVDREKTEPIRGGVEKALAGACARAAGSCDAAVVSDYNKGTLTRAVCETIIRSFRRAGRPVLVGLKSRDYRKYLDATGASLNRAELALITGEEDPAKGAARIMRELRLRFVVLTLGERGMQVFERGGATFRLPAVAREVYDVTGAGDTALAAFALGHAGGLGLEECAALANASAGIVVGKVGTEAVTRAELAASEGDGHRKVVGLDELKRLLAEHRIEGRRIVFTNGCFDLIHEGHVALLRFARSRGDVVVVGLNGDASVRRLKGDSRPILRQRERAAILSAMEAVDYVVLFDEDTPARLIRAVEPDVLVKGEDYADRPVVGRDVVERRGGRVELAPLVKGVSTTDIVDRIRRDSR